MIFCQSPRGGADEVFHLIQLCIRFSVPPVIMTPDGLWQSRPGNISSWCRQSISDGSGACATVSIFIIWFVIRSDSCYSNHCGDHSASPDPGLPSPSPPTTAPAFQQFPAKCVDYKKFVLIAPLLPLSLNSLPAGCHLLTWYIILIPPQPSPSPCTEIYFPPHIKC